MLLKTLWETAQTYYENRKYDAAADKCIELVGAAKADDFADKDEKIKDAQILFAKATMLSSMSQAGTLIDAAIDTAGTAFGVAAGYAKSLEEVFAIEREATTVCHECLRLFVHKQMESMEENATFDKWAAFISAKAQYAITEVSISVRIRSCDHVKALAEVEGVELQKCTTEPDHPFTDSEEHHIYKEVADRIFARASKAFEENSVGVPEAVKIAVVAPLQQLHVARDMYHYCLPREDRELTEEHLDYLMGEAEVRLFLLSAKVSTPGGDVSVLSGNSRAVESYTLRKLREKILQINHEIVFSPIPSEVYTRTQTASAGGCYVATAVYGSYDCPQVWTLRRYRDNTLAQTWYGRAFIHTYYAISPTLVKWFGHTQWFQKLWKSKLDKIVSKLQSDGFESTPYEDRSW